MAWLQMHLGSSTLVHVRTVADTPEAALKELCIGCIWKANDLVHCTDVAYVAVTVALFSAIEDLLEPVSNNEDQAVKRQRLESVVVLREHPSVPKPTPANRPVGWSSGVLPNRPARSPGDGDQRRD
jgi:hypothetical protein